MGKKNKSGKGGYFIILLLVIIAAAIGYFNNKKTARITPATVENNINVLTREDIVIVFLKENGKLPSYYITKKLARQSGWDAAAGNLCRVLPGKAIGGDIFFNREKKLPEKKGRIWQEADINYNCGNRNGQRLLFSDDGLIFATYNHYKSFQQK